MSWLRLVLAVLSGLGVYVALTAIGPDHLSTVRFGAILAVGVFAPDVLVRLVSRVRARRAQADARRAAPS